jgi:ferredoxin--NADP+ reductase
LKNPELWTLAKITHRIDWADGLFTLRYDCDLLPFDPGQFVALGMDGVENGKHGRIERLFSIASAPGEPPEFFVIRVDEGHLSPLLDRLRPGDLGWIHRGPQGVFTLKRVPPCEVGWFLATGTGLAPYIAMLRTATTWDRFKKIVLVHGVRHLTDLAYQEEIKAHQAAHPGRLLSIPAITREEAPPGGLSRRIPQAIEDGSLEKLAGAEIRADNSQVLLCGNPDMIKDLIEILGRREMKRTTGKTPGHITTEKYC